MVGYMLSLNSSSLVSFFALADQELDFCLDTPYSKCNILRAFGLVFRAGTSLVVLSVACDSRLNLYTMSPSTHCPQRLMSHTF